MKAFSYLYLLIAAILFIVAFPVLLLATLKQKYKISIPKRFFLYKNPPFSKEGIWFHVCSYGEVVSLKPILSDLVGDINISVTTNTGYEMAKKYNADVRFLPYELWLPFWVNKQKILVVSEAELWYMLFFMAKLKGAKVILINARISDNSYKSYQRFSFFYKKIFENIDEVFAQSQKDRDRLELLGAKNVKVCGNIKAYGDIKTTKDYKKSHKSIITLASTHDKEEKLLLENMKLRDDMKLIVVPRHPERFDEVAKFLKDYANKNRLSFSRFSQKESFDSDVILVDCMGELVNIYAISDIVLLGGSFVKGVGGHNPLEPAAFGCKIISGKDYFNQKSLYELVENISIIEADELPHALVVAKESKVNLFVDIKPIKEAINSVV